MLWVCGEGWGCGYVVRVKVTTFLHSSLLPEAINHAADAWGIRCLRYEIRDIQLPQKVKEAMQMQVRLFVCLCERDLFQNHFL